jgi:hypothetical protein
MTSAFAYLSRRLAAAAPGEGHRMASAALAALHLAALGILIWSETDFVSRLAFMLAWGLVNCLWLIPLRRPAIAAALSLVFVVLLVLLSRFKHDVLLMTVNFLDIMIIDRDTVTFLLTVFPNLGRTVAIVVAFVLPAVGLMWWLDPLRVRLSSALLGAAICLAGLTTLAFLAPSDPYDEFTDANYVSKFARSGVTDTVDLFTRGYLESDASVNEPLRAAAGDTCRPAKRPPHIVMVFDESSFDIRRLPGVKTPFGYG